MVSEKTYNGHEIPRKMLSHYLYVVIAETESFHL